MESTAPVSVSTGENPLTVVPEPVKAQLSKTRLILIASAPSVMWSDDRFGWRILPIACTPAVANPRRGLGRPPRQTPGSGKAHRLVWRCCRYSWSNCGHAIINALHLPAAALASAMQVRGRFRSSQTSRPYWSCQCCSSPYLFGDRYTWTLGESYPNPSESVHWWPLYKSAVLVWQKLDVGVPTTDLMLKPTSYRGILLRSRLAARRTTVRTSSRPICPGRTSRSGGYISL